MLSSCRYVPTCNEYSMQAYKKFGVVKGTLLTAWRLCRFNPLGGSGYDPRGGLVRKNHMSDEKMLASSTLTNEIS